MLLIVDDQRHEILQWNLSLVVMIFEDVYGLIGILFAINVLGCLLSHVYDGFSRPVSYLV